MIVNLFADHLAQTRPQSAEEVWLDTKAQSTVYAQAAEKVGLTSAEYAEFRKRLLDGDAAYVRLPRHVDAMAGNHHGHVYAIRNAQMTSSVLGWRVRLHDGKTVYVPQTCGNLSVVEPTYVSIPVRHVILHQNVTRVDVATVPYVPTLAQVEPAPVVVSEAPSYPDSIPAPATQPSGIYAIPIIGGIIYGVTHLGGGGTTPPPCSAGSNAEFACRK
jgi:hypothetical protein